MAERGQLQQWKISSLNHDSHVRLSLAGWLQTGHAAVELSDEVRGFGFTDYHVLLHIMYWAGTPPTDYLNYYVAL